MKGLISLSMALTAATPVWAHSGDHQASSLVSALVHLFRSPDHSLALLCAATLVALVTIGVMNFKAQKRDSRAG